MMWRNLLASGRQIGGVNMSELFSATPYTGNGSTQTITNGLDLSTHGGFVWNKSRGSGSHALFDTDRGVNRVLYSDSDSEEILLSNALTSFNSDGFTLGSNTFGNANGASYISWAFRQAPGFFDIVSYNASDGRVIPHNLGSVPGMIIVKRTRAEGRWIVYHRGIDATAPEDFSVQLQLADARANTSSHWDDTAPTDTVFTVGSSPDVSWGGQDYVAYLFAHNPDNGIYCGSYTGTGASGYAVNLGWKPQFLLIKRVDYSGNWVTIDSARVFGTGTDKGLNPNVTGGEFNSDMADPTSTGFNLIGDGLNQNGGDYIFLAIKAA